MWIAYLKQKDDGCGRMIACGQKLVALAAETRDDAIAELLRDHVNAEMKRARGDEWELESVTLYSVSSAEVMPLQQWFDKIDQEKEKS